MGTLIRIARYLYVAYVGFANHFVNKIPFNCVRVFMYRHLYRVKIGQGAVIHMGVVFRKPRWIAIGENTIINPNCFLDGRKTLTIGNNVDIAEGVVTLCGHHDVQAPDYHGITDPIVIEDRAVIFTRAMIVRGLRIGEGAVVGAGSVVTHDVPPYTIVAGNPARKIGERTRDLTYTLDRKTINRTW